MGLSDQERERRRRFDQTEAGRARHRRYNQSPRGLDRDARRRTTVKYALKEIASKAKARGNR